MAKNINPKKIWKCPEKFKLKAVKFSLQKGTMVKDVAANLRRVCGVNFQKTT